MRGRQLVWSDPKIAELSREFVTVADEVYMLYPEDSGNLARVAGSPAHQFFKRFGEAMPPGDWHHPGTKQGIYMIGPDAEYLEGRFAAGSGIDDLRDRMKRALERWRRLRAEKKYRNEPVPAVVTDAPPDVKGRNLVLRAASRDLPRGDGDRSGARFCKDDLRATGFQDFTRWAWNEHWLAFDDVAAWLPRGAGPEPVPDAVVQRLCREVLVDNVRGQAGPWRKEDVRRATLRMRRIAEQDGVWVIEYTGSAELTAPGRSYTPVLFGRARWRPSTRELLALDLVAIGPRTGAWRFNQREQDPGPAPMGIALGLWRSPAGR